MKNSYLGGRNHFIERESLDMIRRNNARGDFRPRKAKKLSLLSNGDENKE